MQFQQARLLAEEARAAWIFVETFDDCRIRLKRLASAKAKDGTLDFAPYRIHVGMSPNAHALVVVGITLVVIFVLMGIMIAIVSSF